jgi:hypothetical protein
MAALPTQVTFRDLYDAFPEASNEDQNRVIPQVYLGSFGWTHFQVILDKTKPHGFRIYCADKSRLEAAEDYTHAALKLPPIDRTPANDNAKPDAVLPKLPLVEACTLHGKPIPERLWLAPGMIPDRTVTLLSGTGGIGKGQIALQLMAAMAIGDDWLGKEVLGGPCIYFGAEDELDELHRRLARIMATTGRELAELDECWLIPIADADATLAAPDRLFRQLSPTPLFKSLLAEAGRIRPKLVILDAAADVFGGDEIKRSEVRRFVQMLRTAAMSLDCAILLISHPSLEGIKTGTGLSGSTAWHNSVRSRLYLEAIDETRCMLSVKKSNYAQKDTEINLRWQDGVLLLDDGSDRSDPIVTSIVNGKVDKLFLELLAVFSKQNRNLCTATGTSFAPKIMATHPKARGHNAKALAEAMQRLLDAERIENLEYGPPSHRRSKLVLAVPAEANQEDKAAPWYDQD